MGGAGDLVKSQSLEHLVVLGKLDTGLQVDAWALQRGGAGFGPVNQPAGQSLTARSGGDGEFSEIETIGFQGQDHAGHRRVADTPDFAGGGLFGHAVPCQPVHRGGRIDPSVHIGEGGLDQRQHVGEVRIAGADLARRQVHVTSPRKM